MNYGKIRTAAVYILSQNVKKRSKKVLRYCRKNCAESCPYIIKNIETLTAVLDSKFLPVHYIVSDKLSGGDCQIPVTAFITEELSDEKEIYNELAMLRRNIDFYYADIDMYGSLVQYCVFLKLYRYAVEDNKEMFLKTAEKFSFPFAADYEKLAAEFDGIEKMLSENSGYNMLTDKSKKNCRIMLAMTAHAAEISEQRLVMQYLTSGEDIAGQIYRDYYRVFPQPSAVKYIVLTVIAPALLSVIGSVILQNPLFLLTLLPFYSLAKFFSDRVCTAYYSKFYREPPAIFTDGKIPDNAKTLCVISTLLTSSADVASSVEKAKRILDKNRTDNFEVCLLCDLPPSDSEQCEKDDEIISACESLAKKSADGISMFLRQRTENKKQGCFMGYERKRGAILQLAEYFFENKKHFTIYGKPPQKPCYFLVLDYDSVLPIDAASKLVGYALCPSNMPVIENGRVTDGYGIFSPVCVSDLYSCMKSGFSAILGGKGGRSAQSYNGSADIYMTVFGEGIFCGKGLIHAESFYKCCTTLPDNKILSHDIIEGGLLRCAGVSVQLTESFPADSTGYFTRLSRWQRGDVQNLPFVFSKKLPLGIMDRFKLCDNFLRVLTPIFTLLCFLTADNFTSAAALLCLVLPFVFSCFNNRQYLSRVLSDMSAAVNRLICEIMLVAKNGTDSLIALILSLYRMAVGKRLLSWTTAFQVSKSKNTVLRTARQFIIPQTAALFILMCGIYSPVCLFAGIMNIAAMPVFMVLDREKKSMAGTEIPDKARTALLETVKAELNFFLTFTGAEDNFLPPDNVQLIPYIKTAHRTSPTNIGMYLLALFSALKLGVLPEEEYRRRTLDTVLTLKGLEKWKGHLYNWYDTRTKKPLDGFVSSVDSGNLLCCLTAVKQGVKNLFPEISDLIDDILNAADMGVFYNHNKGLLAIGYDTRKGKLTENCYDLLMSEARMASYYGIAKGQLPAEHWHRLSRIMGKSNAYSGCLSWSGTCFEYFMPQLVLPSPDGSLLRENLRYGLHSQQKAAHNGIFGISESGFYGFDKELNFQYFAFGVPLAALRPDFHFEKVYSPYSVFLMLSEDFEICYNQLCRMREIGLYNSEYGYYEAVDFSDERSDNKPNIVKSFMAHHKGMSIAAAANALLDNVLIKYFMSDSDMQRGIEMTEERINSGMQYLGGRRIHHTDRKAADKKAKQACTQQTDIPVILANGRASLFMMPHNIIDEQAAVQAYVTGEKKQSLYYPAVYGQYDVYNPYPSFDVAVCENTHRYKIRKGALSSCGGGGVYSFCDRELVLEEKISLINGSPALLHEFSLENKSSAERILDLTVYMRTALGKAEEVTAHPAFSDLFLSCEYHEKENAVTVCRRHRQSGEQSCMAIFFDNETEYFYSFDRENTDRKKPIYKSSGICVPAPCVYISVPIRLKKQEKKTVKMYICCANDISSALGMSTAARTARRLKSNNEKDCEKLSASDIIARRILPHILYGFKNKRPDKKPEGKLSALWKYSIPINLPTILFYCRDNGDCLYSVLKAARTLSLAGLDFSLVLICCSDKEKTEEIKSMAQRSFSSSCSLAVLYKGDMTVEDIAAAEYLSCYTADVADPLCAGYAPEKSGEGLPIKQGFAEKLDGGFANGSFTIAKKPPVPWCKVLANPTFGALVSQDSLGFCWAKNSAMNKLTPWDNDITGRNTACAIYIKEKNSYTDILKNCVCTYKKSTAEYTARTGSGCIVTVTVTVPSRGQAEIIRAVVTNRSDKAVKVTPVLIAYLSGINTTMMKSGCICSRRLSDDEFDGIFSLKAIGGREYYATDRQKALCGDFTVSWDGDSLIGAAELEIAPKGSQTAVFILSYCAKQCDPSLLPSLYTSGSKEQRRLLTTDDIQPAKKIDTGDKLINELVNIWLPDQIIKGRIFARTGFYQNGGAFGFRDQLQDGMAAAYFCPDILKRLIFRCCASQFEKGDVLHWFHVTEHGKMGVRTACSDDMLWLPLAACHYAALTKDYSIFEKRIAYCTGEEFKGEELYGKVGAGRRDTVINHCLAAADYAYRTGPHGLCLIGSGDWNDSYNKVGEKGRGESVWLSMFICMVYDRLCRLPDNLVPQEKKAEYSRRSNEMRRNINLHAYKDGYYIRAFYDNGEMMGEESGESCKIDLLPQAFAVLADINGEENKARSLSAVNLALAQLADYENGLIKLFTPPFSYSGKDNKTGYVSAYPMGVRENGGQYTHAAIWLCMAVEKLGYHDEAVRLLKMICPVYKDTDIYKNEPYYMSADIYTNPDCYGRGGWSIYTGAAGWYYRAMLEIFTEH